MRTLENTPAIPPNDRLILTECRDVLRRLLPGVTVLLYGSGARGNREPDSALDLLILAERRPSPEEQLQAANAVSARLLAEGHSSPKQSGVLALFYQHWVAPGRL